MKRRIVVLPCGILDGGAECVVNASNDSADLGGGVSKALSDECGGVALQGEMTSKLTDEFDGVLEEGDCLVTSAGNSKRFKHVLHVASVDYRVAKTADPRGPAPTVTSPARIQACTEAALAAVADLARAQGTATSVAFPLLGAGSGGLAPTRAMLAMIAGIRAYISADPEAPISQIVFTIPEPDRHATCDRVARAAFGIPS